MFEISVSGWFAAAHQLRLLDGALEPLHGHNWRVVVTYAAPALDAMGVVLDFTILRPKLDVILGAMHDRFLNELSAFANRNPSAENVALHIAEELNRQVSGPAILTCVEVEEAPGCVARWKSNG